MLVWRHPGPASLRWPVHLSGRAHSQCLSSEQLHVGNSDLYYQPGAERTCEMKSIISAEQQVVM